MWQKIKAHPVATVIIFVAGMFAIALLVLGYIFNWGWTGLGPYIPPTKAGNFQRGKTLWDWMQLLSIPIVLAVAGFWFNQIQKTREQRAAEQLLPLQQPRCASRGNMLHTEHPEICVTKRDFLPDSGDELRQCGDNRQLGDFLQESLHYAITRR